MGESILQDCANTGTCGMMLDGQMPQFYVYKMDENEYIAQYFGADGIHLQSIPWFVSTYIYTGLTLHLETDCNGDMGGAAVNSGVCGDCWGGNTGKHENYMDTDDDDVCIDGAANGDADNCPDTPNYDQANNDGDSYGDACDSDDDNDGSVDADDSDDNNPNVCSDNDGDNCDDCSSGVYDLENDCP